MQIASQIFFVFWFLGFFLKVVTVTINLPNTLRWIVQWTLEAPSSPHPKSPKSQTKQSFRRDCWTSQNYTESRRTEEFSTLGEENIYIPILAVGKWKLRTKITCASLSDERRDVSMMDGRLGCLLCGWREWCHRKPSRAGGLFFCNRHRLVGIGDGGEQCWMEETKRAYN